MERLTDPAECRAVTDIHPDYFTFDVEKWLSEPRNYAYKEGDNVAFGEYKSPGVYWVHFCYDTARGREAIDLTKRMFKQLCEDTPLKTAIGFIHVDNRKARWLIRQVGFTSLGFTETEDGLREIFYSPKDT